MREGEEEGEELPCEAGARAQGMLGGGRGGGRQPVARGAVLLPDGTVKSRWSLPEFAVGEGAAENLCVKGQAEKGAGDRARAES